jgi:hypothetical protein
MKRILALLLLLVAPTCAGRQAPADGTSVAMRHVLPAFPIAVPTTKGPVPIVLVHHLAGCGAQSDSTRVWFGCYHYGPPRYIEIEDTLPLAWKWRTLRHEMVHLALAIDGATLRDPDAENAVAEAIAKQEAHAMQMGWPR